MNWNVPLIAIVLFENVPLTALLVSTVNVSPSVRLDWNAAATVKLIVPASAAVPVTFIWLKPVPAAVPLIRPVIVPVANCV